MNISENHRKCLTIKRVPIGIMIGSMLSLLWVMSLIDTNLAPDV